MTGGLSGTGTGGGFVHGSVASLISDGPGSPIYCTNEALDVNQCAAPALPGTVVTLTENPARYPGGTVFSGWSGACSGTGATCTVTMSANETVGARFTTPSSSARPKQNGANFASVFFPHTYSQALASGLLRIMCHGQGTVVLHLHSSTAAPADCAITGRVFLSSAATRYLGLKSPTLASGTFAGPTNYRGQMVYAIKAFPASLARRLKAKHVVAMKVSVTGSATYQAYGPGDKPIIYTQIIDYTGPNQPVFSGSGVGCQDVGDLRIAPTRGHNCSKSHG